MSLHCLKSYQLLKRLANFSTEAMLVNGALAKSGILALNELVSLFFSVKVTFVSSSSRELIKFNLKSDAGDSREFSGVDFYSIALRS